MACGVPCVATDVGDCGYIIADTGKIVPPKDPQALAAAWQSLIAVGVEGRKRLGEKARRRVAEYFSLLGVVKQYEDLYKEVTT
jgi:glycosyltransferase involved in cell wall biosynthesis